MPGAPINLFLEVGVQRGAAIIVDRHNRSSTDNSIGCWLFNGSRNTDGYGQIFIKKNSDVNQTGRSAQTAVLIHKVSWMAANGQNPPARHQISHLCDNRTCFNPDHLCAELAIVNNSRKGCPGEIACSVHHHVIVNLCPHSPRCIRPERDDVYCCLSLKESSPGWMSQASSSQQSETPLLNAPLGPLAAQLSQSSTEYAGSVSLEELAAEGLLSQ
jgi:hypothetical protein